jgi:hypothetical protein
MSDHQGRTVTTTSDAKKLTSMTWLSVTAQSEPHIVGRCRRLYLDSGVLPSSSVQLHVSESKNVHFGTCVDYNSFSRIRMCAISWVMGRYNQLSCQHGLEISLACDGK